MHIVIISVLAIFGYSYYLFLALMSGPSLAIIVKLIILSLVINSILILLVMVARESQDESIMDEIDRTKIEEIPAESAKADYF